MAINRDKIAVKWLDKSTYRSGATVDMLIAEKEQMVSRANEKMEQPYTVASWRVYANSEYEDGQVQDPVLYIKVDRWETDQEQEARIQKAERNQQWQANVDKKKKENMADPEWAEFTRLKRKFQLPLGQVYPATDDKPAT